MTAKAPRRQQAGFLVILFAAVGYTALFLSSAPSPEPAPPTPLPSSSTPPQSSTSSIHSPTSQPSTRPQTPPQPSSTPSSSTSVPVLPSTPTASSTQSIPSTSTSAPQSTTLREDVFAPYRGRGLHIAHLDLAFYGRRCANDAGARLAAEPAIKAKSFSYSQDVHWFVYDPEELPLADLVMLAGASGDATLINDTLL